MLLLHALLLVNFLSPALPEPLLATSLGKLAEVKARVASHRDKLRADLARSHLHHHHKPPNLPALPRLKRSYNLPYHQGVPAPNLHQNQNFHPSGMRSVCPAVHGHARHHLESPPSFWSRTHEDKQFPKMSPHEQNARQSQKAASLDRALQQLGEVKKILNQFEEDQKQESHLRQRQNFGGEPTALERLMQNMKMRGGPDPMEGFDERPMAGFNANPNTNGNLDPVSKPVDDKKDVESKLKDSKADPHLHNHGHVHSHGHFPVVPTHLAPNVNVDVHQSQGLHQSGHQGFSLEHGKPFFHSRTVNNFGRNAEQIQGVQALNKRLMNPLNKQNQQLNFARSEPILTDENLNKSNESVLSFDKDSHARAVGTDGPSTKNENTTELNIDNRKSEELVRTKKEDMSKSDVIVEAPSPTFKKLKKMMKKDDEEYEMYPTYNSYPSYSQYSYSPYREAEHPLQQQPFFESRAASPTFKKLKKKKDQTEEMTFYPAYDYQPSYYNHDPYRSYFREADDVNPEDRGAEPSLHKKSKKKKQPGRYRDAEENLDLEEIEGLSDPRDADPSFKKKKKKKKKQPSYYPSYQQQYGGGYYREADADEDFPFGSDPPFGEDADVTLPHDEEDDAEHARLADLTDSYYLFNVPKNPHKRSLAEELDQILGAQRKLLQTLHDSTKDDEDLKFLTDLGNRTLSVVEDERKNLTKRSIPLTRLIADSNVKLDVPKTFENLGTATKHAIEDERAPLYHLKHLMGSSRDAILSAMRIPSQNMIVPSEYEIVKSRNRQVGRPDLEDEHSRTFKRVGEMVRESVKSGQETAEHLGEMAHRARKMMDTARRAAPRLIVPYSHIPAVQDTRLRKPSKAILVTPRLVDLTHQEERSKDSRPDFVRLEHIMDAVGLSKPNPKALDLHKFIFEPRLRKKSEAETVGDALSTLEDAKLSVGAKSLRDFLLKMKGELNDMVRMSPEKKKVVKKQQAREMGKFVETLFDRDPQSKNGGAKNGDDPEIVAAGLPLAPELLKPFMGRPTKDELAKFFRDNGDDDFETMMSKLNSPKNRNEDVVQSINPLVYERLFNETLPRQENAAHPEELFDDGENSTVGIFMKMDHIEPEEVENFLDPYSNGNSQYDEPREELS